MFGTCIFFILHLFKTLCVQPCFWSSCATHHGSTHICNGESGSFYPAKWDPFWCDIWENNLCMGSVEEVSSLLCYWLKPTTAHLSFSDGFYPWPWTTVERGEPPHHHQRTSLIPVPSCCQSARCIRCPVLLLLYFTVGSSLLRLTHQVPWRFKAGSDSLCGLTCAAPSSSVQHLRAISYISVLSPLGKFDLWRWYFEIPHKRF